MRTLIFNCPGRKTPLTIVAIGVDLAKNVFAVHGINGGGAVELPQPRVVRARRDALMASLLPRLIGMEVCSGAHHWARQCQAKGRRVKQLTGRNRGASMNYRLHKLGQTVWGPGAGNSRLPDQVSVQG
ncbi:MAG: hypothetical protein JNL87_11680 [Burkholderiaceae bacterium]|nr:hypothetical protein [Burkholderiaceae bacterium]